MVASSSEEYGPMGTSSRLCTGARWALASALAAPAGCYAGTTSQDGRDAGSSGSGQSSGGGDSGETGESGGSGPDSGGDGDGWEEPALPDEAPLSPAARLTQIQWRRSVQAAFDLSADQVASIALPEDGTDGIFETNAVDTLGTFDGYVSAAEAAGTLVAERLGSECGWTMDTAGCAGTWLGPAFERLVRQPLGSTDLEPVTAVMVAALNRGQTSQEAIGAGVSRMLLDPRFVFRLEHGVDALGDDAYTMVGTELAARLALTAANAPPDSALAGLGVDGTIQDPDILAEQADRVLAEPGARDMIWRFARDWLGLKHQGGELGDSMEEETRRMVEHVLYSDELPLSELFTARYSFIDARLAELYGVPAPANDWDRVEFPPEAERAGVLTHASFLASNGAEKTTTAWIFRGKIVVEHLLCYELPDPPPGVADMDAEIDDREAHPVCGGCHRVIDPAGRMFQRYDAHGALLKEEDLPSAGAIQARSDIDGEFAGSIELGQALANSRALGSCFTRMWFRYLLGRHATVADQRAIDDATQVLATTGSTRQLLRSLLSSPSFRTVYLEDYRP